MTDTVETAAENIAADLAALRRDIAGLAEAMSKLLQYQTQTAASRVSTVVGDATENVVRTADDARNRVCAASHDVGALIGRNPLTAVLVLFGVGISVGLLSRLRG